MTGIRCRADTSAPPAWTGSDSLLEQQPSIPATVSSASAACLPDAIVRPAGAAATSPDRVDVVVPDLPGYGFSARPRTPGVSNGPIAEALHALMTRELGYERYGVRVSDIGAGVAASLAMAHPEAVIGLHTSGSNPWLDTDSLPDDLSAEEQEMVEGARRSAPPASRTP